MLQKLLLEDEEGRSVVEFVISKTLCIMSAAAWDDIPSITLLKSWNKLLAALKIHTPLLVMHQPVNLPSLHLFLTLMTNLPGSPTTPSTPPCELLAQQLNDNLSRSNLCIDVAK